MLIIVQPGGKYHYHGLPKGLLEQLKVSSASTHSPVVGWAADGFPIYALYGYANGRNDDAGVKSLKSSYRIKNGMRPGGAEAPGGRHDGAFIADYEFSEGSGDLDQCNGASVHTPDFPSGTYAYFLTTTWPVVARCFMGSPDSSFDKRGRGRRSGPRRGGRPAGCKQSLDVKSGGRMMSTGWFLNSRPRLFETRPCYLCVTADRPDAQVSVSKDVSLWSVSPP